MPRPADVLMFLILAVCSLTTVHAQENPTTANSTGGLKTLVVAAEAKSDSVIAVPPVTSMTVELEAPKRSSDTDAVNFADWLEKEATLNGLQSTDLRPWHIVVSYDHFDEDGDNVHSGVYEEYWVGAKKYKRIYTSDNFNQTDYATDKGLYRYGDQSWPDNTQSRVRTEVIAPFSYAATLRGFHRKDVERTFSGYKLHCVAIEMDSRSSNPTL
jgi:hypothetical protein